MVSRYSLTPMGEFFLKLITRSLSFDGVVLGLGASAWSELVFGGEWEQDQKFKSMPAIAAGIFMKSNVRFTIP